MQWKITILRRLSNDLPYSLLEKIDLSCIQTNFDYADSVWRNICGVSGTHSVQRLKNYAARIICKKIDFVNLRGEELIIKIGRQLLDKRRNSIQQF